MIPKIVGIILLVVSTTQVESRQMTQGMQTLSAQSQSAAGPSDVSLKIRASEDGTSELNFLVYGEGGSEYSLSNDAKGTFRIESGEKLCLEIKTQNEEAEEAKNSHVFPKTSSL